MAAEFQKSVVKHSSPPKKIRKIRKNYLHLNLIVV
nr:MAG TPA: hypothetical protein [Caudoviricetes sp.]